jgi:hypothetical protein
MVYRPLLPVTITMVTHGITRYTAKPRGAVFPPRYIAYFRDSSRSPCPTAFTAVQHQSYPLQCSQHCGTCTHSRTRSSAENTAVHAYIAVVPSSVPFVPHCSTGNCQQQLTYSHSSTAIDNHYRAVATSSVLVVPYCPHR